MRWIAKLAKLCINVSAKATGVLEPAPTLPAMPSRGGPLALVSSAQDFLADELWLWSDQSFGARHAPLSLVG